MSNTEGWLYRRGEGLIKTVGEKRANELAKLVDKATKKQPDELEEGTGAKPGALYFLLGGKCKK